MQDFARLNATLGKMTIVDETTAKIEMTFPVKDAQKNFMFLTGKQKQKVVVALGDPQMVMRFSEEEMLQPYPGRYFTADHSGVVTNIQRKEDEEEDEDQGDLFEQNTEGEATESGAGEEADGEAASDDSQDTPESGDGEQEDGADESMEWDTPEWMRESDDEEVNFESEESGTDEAGASEETVALQEAENTEVDKEALEQYILEHRPAFDEIPIDFPSLLEERLSSNKTWREIANEAGMTSGQLSSRWSTYKKRVAERMKDGGAA